MVKKREPWGEGGWAARAAEFNEFATHTRIRTTHS